MTSRLHDIHLQSTLNGSHRHHLASDIVETHAQQGAVALLQSEEIISAAGRCQHTAFLHHHPLRRAGRATRLHLYTLVGVVPLRHEFFNIH